MGAVNRLCGARRYGKVSGPATHDSLLQTVRRKLAALFGTARIGQISVAANRPTASLGKLAPKSSGQSVRAGTEVGILSPCLLGTGRSNDATQINVGRVLDAVADLTMVSVNNGLFGEISGRSERMSLDCSNIPHIRQAGLIPAHDVTVNIPANIRIGRAQVQVADVNRPRPLTKADRRALPVAFKATHVGHVPYRVEGEVPLERRRVPMLVPDPTKPPIGSEREIALLKAASGEPDADIKLVGVYCCVPVGAASRLEFDSQTGSLMLNIRENAFETIGSAKRPIVTLVLGQIVSTGRMIRALRPDTST